jgi:hypothetical protein
LDGLDNNYGRLTQKEKAVLYAAYSILDSRLNMHISREAIRGKLRGKAQWKIKKTLKSIVSKGLLQEHPTSRGVHYTPTSEGIKLMRKEFPDLFPI